MVWTVGKARRTAGAGREIQEGLTVPTLPTYLTLPTLIPRTRTSC